MNGFHQLALSLLFFLVTSLGAVSALAMPYLTSDAHFLTAQHQIREQSTNIAFAAHASSLAGSNVTIIGGVTVMQASAFALRGQETTVGGELALGLSGATTAQVFYTVGAAGTLVMRQGDVIFGLVDDLGRVFKPVSQTVDDAGRFLVQATDGTVGYFDDVGRFVPNAPNTGQYVDILSPASRKHILYGDGPGSGGHLWPGQPGKTVFPESWSGDKIIDTIGDITTSPNTIWYAQTGTGGQLTKAGNPANWVAWATVDGVRIRVVYQPALGRVVTGFPDNNPIPNLTLVP